MGDHTDYNGGVALPMAIDLATEAVFAPLGAPTCTSSPPRSATRSTSASSREATGTSGHRLGSARGRRGRGARPVPGRGAGLEQHPDRRGLSSSAAFSVALALSLGAPPDPKRLAVLCRDAEARAGADVGLMDPFVIVAATRAAPSDRLRGPRASDVACPTTRVHGGPLRRVRQLASSAYAERRAECARAAALIGVLGHATTGAADAISDPLLRRRARHV